MLPITTRCTFLPLVIGVSLFAQSPADLHTSHQRTAMPEVLYQTIMGGSEPTLPQGIAVGVRHGLGVNQRRRHAPATPASTVIAVHPEQRSVFSFARVAVVIPMHWTGMPA